MVPAKKLTTFLSKWYQMTIFLSIKKGQNYGIVSTPQINMITNGFKRSSQLRTLLKRVVENRTWKKIQARMGFEPWPLKSTNGFLFVSNRSNVSQLVTLDLDSKPITVLCQMGDFGCGDGGWTPVMKIKGSQVSLLWRNIFGGVFLRVMKRMQ